MTMFPSMASNSDDLNRKVHRWQPGDPTPRTVIAAFALISFIAVLMVVTGVVMLTLKWDRLPADAQEAEAMDFVLNNVRILGGINVVLGIALAVFSRGLRDGYRDKRRWVLWLGVLAIFFQLAGWVFQFTAMGQALLALGLALGLVLAFRPAADPFFDADHRLEDGTDSPRGTDG